MELNGHSVLMKDSRLRSFYKSVSWRLIASIDICLVSWLITNNIILSLKISASLILVELMMYYFHERLWNIIRWGRMDGIGPTVGRSTAKASIWLIIGAINTIILSFILTQNWNLALKIGLNEVFTKVVLYYLHERFWGKKSFGRYYCQVD